MKKREREKEGYIYILINFWNKWRLTFVNNVVGRTYNIQVLVLSMLVETVTYNLAFVFWDMLPDVYYTFLDKPLTLRTSLFTDFITAHLLSWLFIWYLRWAWFDYNNFNFSYQFAIGMRHFIRISDMMMRL